jgi:hypothetical protein
MVDRVYKTSQEGKIKIFSTAPNRRKLRAPKYHAIGTCDTIPEDTERTTITDKGEFVWCQGSQPATQQTNITRDLEDFVHDDDKWAIRKIMAISEHSNYQDAESCRLRVQSLNSNLKG